jgi:uncharacterized protein
MPWTVWLGVWFVMLGIAVVVPWVLVVHVGRHGPRVLRGGSWTNVPIGWLTYCALCWAAVVVAAISRRIERKDPALLGHDARTFDVATPLPAPPAGAGVRSWVARMPGNDIFRVEVNERQVALPRLPPDLDGLSVLHLTDLPLNGTPGRAFFERALELAEPLKPDLIALTGDILDHYPMHDWLPTTLGRLGAPLGRFFVLGNHDALDEPEKIRGAMTDLGWTDVGGRAIVRDVRGHSVLIAGTERPWLGAQPEAPDGQLEPSLRLLLSHTPEQFAWARSRRYDLVLACHLHGGQIDLPLFGPISGGRYHAGVFSAAHTVMHVSRGLGVMFPVRWRCPAEITKLILRSK